MAKKWIGIIAAVLLAVGGGAYWYLAGKTYEIRITQQQIEEQLKARMPFHKSYVIFSVTLANAQVQLSSGTDRTDRIKASVDVSVALQSGTITKPLSATVSGSAGVRYDPARGAFFLTDPAFEPLAVAGISDKHTAAAVNAALNKAMAAYFAEQPIYRLRTTDTKHLAARLALKSVTVEDGAVVARLGL